MEFTLVVENSKAIVFHDEKIDGTTVSNNDRSSRDSREAE
jgi:hypothetical protein